MLRINVKSVGGKPAAASLAFQGAKTCGASTNPVPARVTTMPAGWVEGCDVGCDAATVAAEAVAGVVAGPVVGFTVGPVAGGACVGCIVATAMLIWEVVGFVAGF